MHHLVVSCFIKGCTCTLCSTLLHKLTIVHRIAEVLLVTVVTTVVMYSSGMTVASCLPMKDLNNVAVSSIATYSNNC